MNSKETGGRHVNRRIGLHSSVPENRADIEKAKKSIHKPAEVCYNMSYIKQPDYLWAKPRQQAAGIRKLCEPASGFLPGARPDLRIIKQIIFNEKGALMT